MKRLDTSFLRKLSAEVANNARRRKNHNLHASSADPIQRMLNAFEPATYIRPHRHAGKWELFVVVCGRAAVLLFDDAGQVLERVELDAQGNTRIVEIPAAAWHTVVSLAPGTVLFEVKAGPYLPTASEDFASWAPAEGEATAPLFERWFLHAAAGDRSPISERT